MADPGSPHHQDVPLPCGPQRRLMGFVLALFAVAVGMCLIRFPHPYSDDDANHFLIAKDAVTIPRLFLQIWGRPGFTLLHALPAQFGFFATRLFSVFLSLLTAACVALILKPQGRRVQAFGLAFCLFQTYFFHLADGALTETVYACSLALGLLALQRNRLGWAALAFSYSCVCRFEGAAFLPLVYAVMVARVLGDSGLAPKRKARRLIGLGLGLGSLPLLWNFLCSWDTGFTKLLPLVSENIFVNDPTGFYGSGPWYQFPLAAPEIHGWAIFACLLPGLFLLLRRREFLLPIYFLLFYAIQSALWAGGHFRTGGYNRFFASMAPVAALIAAEGAGAIFHALERRWSKPRLQLAAAALIACTACEATFHCIEHDLRTDEQYEAMLPAVAIMKKLGGVSKTQPLLSASIYPMLLLNISKWREGPELLPYNHWGLSHAPEKAFILYVSMRSRPFDPIKPFDLFDPSEKERLAERMTKNYTWIHLLKKPRPRFELLGTWSLVGRSWGHTKDTDPWPYHVKLLRVRTPASHREATPPKRSPYIWAW